MTYRVQAEGVREITRRDDLVVLDIRVRLTSWEGGAIRADQITVLIGEEPAGPTPETV